MTVRQYLLKSGYPVIRFFQSLLGSHTAMAYNTGNAKPLVSFYGLHAISNDGTITKFDSWKGRKVLLVNTASDCGYTAQYSALEKLYRKYQDRLVIVAFPANDFKGQEQGSDQEIAAFCRINYGVTFPLMKKSTVLKGGAQNEVFRWLTDKRQNGWNDRAPTWNFSKYLVDENGILVACFSPYVSPLSASVQQAILS